VAITSGQDDEPEGVDNEASGYLVYELNEWSRESRQMLQQLLEGEDVPFVWEATNLVVPAPFESQVDEATAQVEATNQPPLDPEAEKLLYELTEWTESEIAQLADSLAEADLAYEFDVDGNLVVLASDEAAVEQLLDTIEFPDALEADDSEEGPGPSGPEANAVLSDLFVASDRLRHHARDHEGVLGMVEAATQVEHVSLPYGFEPKVWEGIVERARSLRSALEGDDVSDEDIESQADELRTLLREFV
jgi:hypothetical protein